MYSIDGQDEVFHEDGQNPKPTSKIAAVLMKDKQENKNCSYSIIL